MSRGLPRSRCRAADRRGPSRSAGVVVSVPAAVCGYPSPDRPRFPPAASGWALRSASSPAIQRSSGRPCRHAVSGAGGAGNYRAASSATVAPWIPRVQSPPLPPGTAAFRSRRLVAGSRRIASVLDASVGFGAIDWVVAARRRVLPESGRTRNTGIVSTLPGMSSGSSCTERFSAEAWRISRANCT